MKLSFYKRKQEMMSAVNCSIESKGTRQIYLKNYTNIYNHASAHSQTVARWEARWILATGWLKTDINPQINERHRRLNDWYWRLNEQQGKGNEWRMDELTNVNARLTDWMNDWLNEGRSLWMNDWLKDWRNNWLNNWLTCWFQRMTDIRTDWLTLLTD